LKSFHEKDNRVKVIQFRRNFGKSAALAAGFQESRGTRILTIDGDLQDLPEEIPRLIEKLDEGYDLISSWRYDRKDAFLKKAVSKIYNMTVSRLSHIAIHDFNSGLKCYRRDVIEEIKISRGMHRYVPVLAAWKGFNVGEIKVKHSPRLHGQTKYSMGKVVQGFFDFVTTLMLTKYSRRPFHVFGYIGFILLLAGMGITAYLGIGWFFGRWIGDRPLLLLGAVLMIIGFQIIFFGLLSEILVDSSNQNQVYSIRKKLN
jgi:glycosyltransferase involved in cell wall biosynthesis